MSCKNCGCRECEESRERLRVTAEASVVETMRIVSALRGRVAYFADTHVQFVPEKLLEFLRKRRDFSDRELKMAIKVILPEIGFRHQTIRETGRVTSGWRRIEMPEGYRSRAKDTSED